MLKITYQSAGLENSNIPQTTAIAIYRIIQEMINNAIKHAGAKNAIVQVNKTNGEMAVTVEDDGKGFDPVILQASKGMGWNNIQSRCRSSERKARYKIPARKRNFCTNRIQYIMATKLFIVDDHYMVIEGIRSLLQHEANIEWIGHAMSASSCLAFLQQQLPDVILMDINLPDKSGIDLCKEVQEKYPSVFIIRPQHI